MPDIETIYLVHHSHTDIGYTNDQPIVWDLNTRFIDEALDLAERDAGHNSDSAFRWTVETTAPLISWLQHASSRDIERLQELEKAGRVEVTGMFAHLTPLVDTDQLIESLDPVRSLRSDYGFTIRYAMDCDVNGVNWPLADVLLDNGIEGFSMAINTHFGGALEPRPLPFLWQAPSGRTLPTLNGWTYDKGWREGIGRDASDFETHRWPQLQAYLREIGYPLPILMLQSFHPYGDVGTAYDYAPFIEAWNASGKTPRIVFSTPSMWWGAVRPHLASLPTLRGDWTDFWNFGAISSARETAMNRRSRQRLRDADALYAALEVVGGKPGWARQSFTRHREKAYWNLHFWDEHTWGADTSIRKPFDEDTASQWHHKASYAYNARSLSQLLMRDALADLAQLVERDSSDDILAFNPSPSPRTLGGPVPPFVTSPRGVPEDSTAGRHHQDRLADVFERHTFVLPPTELPGFGYAVCKRGDLLEGAAPDVQVDQETVENGRFRALFDTSGGGIMSLYDKLLEHEWVSNEAPWPLNTYVYETLAEENHAWPRSLMFEQPWSADLAEIPPGWKTDWEARRTKPERLVSHQIHRGPLGTTVVQTLEAEGAEGTMTQETFFPDSDDFIECSSYWNMGLNDAPEATYLSFPFNLSGAVARYDVGGQAVVPERDQLPGVCRDYFTAQNWVDFSNAEMGMTVTLPQNPLVQLGGFHFGHYQRRFELAEPHLLGWVTNNYWETNFRAAQPGRVEARYRLYPHAGPFEEPLAHRVGSDAARPLPLFQHLGEPSGETPLPSRGTFLELPAGPVEVLHLKATEGGLLLRMLNTSETTQPVEVGSSLLRITGATWAPRGNEPAPSLNVSGGKLTFALGARRSAEILLACNSSLAGRTKDEYQAL